MNPVLATPSAVSQDYEPTDGFACLLLAPSACTEPIEQPESMAFTGLFEVEPAGIEPATSCLQSRSDCPLVSRCVPKIPANLLVLLDTGGHDRTARDNLMHPWCTLSVACVWAAPEQGSRRRYARLRQLVEVAAPSKAALASAIAVCASSRGMSSNSSITWP
jgi:hypothetical protein